MGLDLAAIKEAFFLHILQRSLRSAWSGLGIVFESKDKVVMSLVNTSLILLIPLLSTTWFLLSYQSVANNSILFYINSAKAVV